MKYTVSVGPHAVEVEIGQHWVKLDGQEVPARLETVGVGPLRYLTMEGSTTPMVVEQGGEHEGWTVQVAGRAWPVEVLDERAMQLREMARRSDEAPGGGGLVKAPMPGLVLRWEVEEGQSVGRGTGLVVLEAMKMENEIRAVGVGVVRRILVAAGTAVEKGTPLVEIGPSS